MLTRIVYLLLFFFSLAFCQGQVTPLATKIQLTSFSEKTKIIPSTLVFVDSLSSLTIEEVNSKEFHPLAALKYGTRLSPQSHRYTYYLKYYLENNTSTPASVYFYPGICFSLIETYKLFPAPHKAVQEKSHPGFRKINMEAGEAGFIVIALRPIKNEFNFISPMLIKADYFQDYISFELNHLYDSQFYGIIISGILLMMIMFMFANYIISRKTEFVYNALYSLCMFLLIYLNSTLTKNSSDFINLYYSYLDFFLLVTGILFYITFTRKFLNTRSNYLYLDKILKYGERFVVLLMALYTYLNFFTGTYLPQYYLELFMKLFILGIGVAFIYLAIKRKDRLFNYLAAGNAALVMFSSISLVFMVLRFNQSIIYYTASFYYNTGIVFELVFFLLGLTYKNRREIIANIQEQEALKQAAEKTAYETEIAVIKAQQEERNRISADMHDDLGAGMTTIRLYSELAKSKMTDNPIPEINKISNSANELLNKMNAIIWSMSSSNDTLNNLIAYIRSYILEYFEDTGINCKISIPENLPNVQVRGEFRRNVFLVIKEALNNTLKHANATEVTIVLKRVDDGLTLYIQDNGTGIDFDKIRQFGNGLKNMKKRMQDLEIDFSIENNNGTLITLHRKISGFNPAS